MAVGGGVGASISRKVVDQLEARKRVMEKTVGRSNEDLMYLTGKTGWVRLQSGVNTLSPEEIEQIKHPENRINITGDNRLAGYNILQGGLLNPNRGLREGINVEDNYDPISLSDKAAYNNRPNSTGIRPMPGITSMNVKSKNTFGTLREADVNFMVWTLEDFEIMQKVYLRPGFTMLLEWGHSMYITNDGTLVQDIETIGNRFYQQGIGMQQLLGDIKTLREKSNYNYEGMVGYVKNFSWKYTNNGGYECSVSIISTGEILESLQLSFNPKKRFPKEEFADNVLYESDASKEEKKSVYHYFISRLQRITSDKFTREDLAVESPTLASKLKDFTGYYQDVQLDDTLLLDEDTPMHWVPLYTVLDVFNTCISTVDLSKDPSSPDRAYAKFNTQFYETTDIGEFWKSSTYVTSGEHFSIDPTVCVLPIGASTTTTTTYLIPLGNTVIPYVTADSYVFTVDSISKNLQLPENTLSFDILNILISMPYLKQKLDEAMDQDGKFNKSAYDVFKSMLDGMSTALGGINDFDFWYDDDENMYYVIDRNYIPPSSPGTPELTLAGLSSVFTDVSISSKISNEIGSQISVAAQGSTLNYSGNVENILRWNEGLIDRVRLTKDDQTEKTTTQQEIEDDRKERTDDWLEDVQEFFDSFNSGDGYDKSDMEAAKTMHAEWTVENVVKKNCLVTKTEYPGIVPVELSFKTDGIGGFKIGETFKIAPGILPSDYQDKFGYIITGLEHEIGDGNRWETSVTTQFYSIQKPTDQEGSSLLATNNRLLKQELQGVGYGGAVPTTTPPTELVQAMRRYGITNPTERAHFLSQCAHESGGFRWKKEFASGKAYEGRKDLGNTQTGDGVKFKGRGYIQITGRANYQKYQNYLKSIGSKVDIMTNPATLETNYFAADSACYWWKFLSRNISGLAKAGTSPANVQAVTKRVNGGTNGIADRQARFKGYWDKIEKDPSTYA